MNRNISPPPPKRRKTSNIAPTLAQKPHHDPNTSPPPNPNTMRIFSWNINGITPFLQTPITSYLQAAATPRRTPSIPRASLRAFLQRHNWPAILFLQEVKIGARDKKTQDAVRIAVDTRPAYAPGSHDDKGPKYGVYFTLPNDPHNARGPRGSGKAYGVCSIVRSDFSSFHSLRARTVS